MKIIVKPEEIADRKFTETTVNLAVNAIRVEGYIILENIISHEHLDLLRERMDSDSQILIKAEKWGGVDGLKGHLQQSPPPFTPYVFRDIVANPYIIQVTKALLGEGVYNNFYSGNTNCPGSRTQPLHRDNDHLWQNQEIAHPTAEVVINISPQETTEENGSVELWPGSHLDVSGRWIDAKQEGERRKIALPIRGSAKKGSALIRDIRLWHRGVPNHSDSPRHMIAMIHRSWWLRPGRCLKYKAGCETEFQNSDLNPNAEFVDTDIDYLLNPEF